MRLPGRLPAVCLRQARRIALSGWRLGRAAAMAAAACAAAHGQTPAASDCLQGREGAAQLIAQCTSELQGQGLTDARRAALLTQRGLAHIAARELGRARDDFDEAIRLDGSLAWAYNSRAVAWMQGGDTDRAIADYERALERKPDYAFAWANLGGARLAKGDLDQALEDLGKAIRLAPAHSEIALTTRGKVWLAKGDYDRAGQDFDAALRAKPNHANALSGRATAYFCKGQFDQAAADVRSERLIRRDAESAAELLIAARRGGHDGRAELAEVTRDGEAGGGVPTAVALFNGTITPEQALQASDDRDPVQRRQRRCAAEFEVGEWYLLHSDVVRSRRYLEAARETCDPSRREYASALAELSRLKSPE